MPEVDFATFDPILALIGFSDQVGQAARPISRVFSYWNGCRW